MMLNNLILSIITSIFIFSSTVFANINQFDGGAIDLRLTTTMASVINLPSNLETKNSIIGDIKTQGEKMLAFAINKKLPKKFITLLENDFRAKVELAKQLPIDALKAIYLADLQEIQMLASINKPSANKAIRKDKTRAYAKTQLFLIPIGIASKIISLPIETSFNIFS